MRNKIIMKLHDIEKEHDVKILYAVESGSRAWGFESTDSDYDVRFIYAHPKNWYISIEDKRDVIEYPVEGLLDFSGWDIKKALKLYRKSNPPLYEWLISPIVYLEIGDFTQKLRNLIPRFYSSISSIHHYLHMAQGNNRQYLKGEIVRIKKYFYVLRPIFACIWIEQFKSQPPMEFMKMLNTLKLDNKLKAEVENLYKRKKAGEELDKEKRISIISDFLDEKILYFESYVKEIKLEHQLKADPFVLDTLLLDTLS